MFNSFLGNFNVMLTLNLTLHLRDVLNPVALDPVLYSTSRPSHISFVKFWLSACYNEKG